MSSYWTIGKPFVEKSKPKSKPGDEFGKIFDTPSTHHRVPPSEKHTIPFSQLVKKKVE